MNLKTFTTLIALSLLAILNSCGTQKNAGGFGSETENTISGTIVHLQRPVAQAQIIARNMITNDSSTTKTNDAGNWQMSIAQGVWQIECVADSIGAQTRIITHEAESLLVALTLDTLVTSQNKQLELANRSFKIKGMNRNVNIANDGSWEIAKLPQGAYWITDSLGNEGVLYNNQISIWDSNKGILLENFEDSLHAHNLYPFVNGSFWQLWSKNETTWPSEYIQSIQSAAPFSGKHSLYIELKPLIGDTLQLVLPIGSVVSDSANNMWHKTTNLTAFKFSARGYGTIYFTVSGRSKDNKVDEFSVAIPLTSTWSEYQITPQQLQSLTRSGVNFSDHEMSLIKWTTPYATNLELDEIWLEGMQIEDLFK